MKHSALQLSTSVSFIVLTRTIFPRTRVCHRPIVPDNYPLLPGRHPTNLPHPAGLNEALVRYLMERDEQHMEQDSKLVHIEDLTSYFGQKQQDAPPPPPPQPQPTTADAKRRPLRIGLGRAK